MTKVHIALVASALCLSGCMSGADADYQARLTLEAQGFTHVTMTGSKWLGCGEDDYYARSFNAMGAGGRPVEGVVCGDGSSKGWTVRVTGVGAPVIAYTAPVPTGPQR